MPERRDRSFRRNWAGYVLVAPAAIFVLLIAIYPLLYGISLSFVKYDLTEGAGRSFVAFQNYAKALRDPVFGRAVVNTAVWVFFNVTFQLLIATIIALILNGRIVGRSFFRTSVLIPWAIPSVIAVLTFRFLYDAKAGIFNILLMKLGILREPVSWLGSVGTAMPAVLLINIYRGIPFVFVFVLAALQSISQDVYESAEIDGVSVFQRFFRIILPMIKEPIGVAVILTTIGSFNTFNTIWLTTQGGPLNATKTVFLYAYWKAFMTYSFGQSAAVSVILFVVVMAITSLYIRMIDAGEKWR